MCQNNDRHREYCEMWKKELKQTRQKERRQKWKRTLLLLRLLKLLKKIESLLPEKDARRELEKLRDDLMYGF